MDDSVCSILETNGLQAYIPVFRDNEIDEAAFRKLTKEDLKVLCGGKIGPQRKLQQAIEELTGGSNSATGRVVQSWGGSSDLDSYETEKVLVCIDNSNVIINTQQHAAKFQKFGFGIKYDGRRRVDIGRFLNCVAGTREILRATLYGSEPPMVDSVWKKIREKKVIVKTYKKSTWNQREKQVDMDLGLEALDDINTFLGDLGSGSMLTLVVVSGDRDMLKLMKMALQKGCRVEIWAYEAALANDIRKLEKMWPSQMRTVPMDREFLNMTFGVYEWRKTYVPPERSMVLLLNYEVKAEEVRRQVIKDVVKRSTEILRMPMLAKVLGQTVSVAEPNGQLPGGIGTANRYAAFQGSQAQQKVKCYTPVVLICYEKAQRSPHELESNGSPVEPKLKYDFNKHVWSQKDKLQEAIDNCAQILTYQSFCQTHGDIFLDEIYVAGNVFVEDDVDDNDPDSLDVDYNVVAKKEKRKKQLYSEACIYRFRCKNGTSCKHRHTDEQKEFFKAHPNAQRWKYKTQPCNHEFGLSGRKCRYHDKSYLCMFAHSQSERYCPFCTQIGNHWPDECSEKPGSTRY